MSDCKHEKTSRRFGGIIVCAACEKAVGREKATAEAPRNRYRFMDDKQLRITYARAMRMWLKQEGLNMDTQGSPTYILARNMLEELVYRRGDTFFAKAYRPKDLPKV